MDKRPGEELRAGLAKVADIPGVVLLSTPAWDQDRLRWVLHCRITADADPEGPIPRVTDWFVLIGEGYPHGRIGIYPAKTGGITKTFPHQNYNGEGSADSPWRSGKLCTWTNAAPLHRRGYDSEPAEPELNLAWHLQRAQTWLELASEGGLTQTGDPFELPYVPHGNGLSIAFCEGSSTLRSWLQSGKRCGIAKGQMREAEPPILAVTRFESGKDRQPVEQEWGRGVAGEDAQDSAWIRLDGVPVLPPYQIPMTWGELREACRIQGAELDALLRPAVGGWPAASRSFWSVFPYRRELADRTRGCTGWHCSCPKRPLARERVSEIRRRAVGWPTGLRTWPTTSRCTGWKRRIGTGRKFPSEGSLVRRSRRADSSS